MSKRKILIVEDDPLIADSLELIVTEIGYQCIGKAENVTEALHLVADQKPDLMLLDINLEGNQEGLDIAEIVYKREKTPCIFITAYSDEKTVARGAKTEPYGYLIKPFNQTDVRVALKLAFSAIERNESQSNELIDQDGTIYIKESNGYQKVNISDIKFVNADDIYSIIVTDYQRCMISKPLKKVEELIKGYGFVRIHKSHIINKKFVDKIRDGQVIIGNHAIPIGRAYKDDLMRQLKIV